MNELGLKGQADILDNELIFWLWWFELFSLVKMADE